MSNILAFAGSARNGSLNMRLVRAAAALHPSKFTVIDLAEFELPLYNGDLEAEHGVPAAAVELKRLLSDHAGILIGCPEYNGSITPLLKNTIDWVSRPTPDAPELTPFRGKAAALLSASPGGFGGMRGLVHVRAILAGVGAIVLPGQLSLPKAHEAFEDEGSLADEGVARRLNGVVDALVDAAARLA